jgi:hypothetical protein
MRGTKRNENFAVEASTVSWERMSTVGSVGLPPLAALWNTLATSYLNAIVQMTGMELEPEPPTVAIDRLGTLLCWRSPRGRSAA